MTRKSRAVFNGGRGLRKIYQGLCGSCGAQFSNSYCYTLYCSNACRQRAFRMRVQKQRLGLSLVQAQHSGMETRAWHGTPIARRVDGFVTELVQSISGGTPSFQGLWTPANINTALWLDGADASTITLNGSTVSQWNDKSGNGRHVSQATASQQHVLL